MKRKKNLLAEVLLVSHATCWCYGVSGTKRKLLGLVFSPICFEQLSPGSTSAIPSGRVVGEMHLPPLPSSLVHQWGVVFGFWTCLFYSHPDKMPPAHLSACVKQMGSLFGEGKKKKKKEKAAKSLTEGGTLGLSAHVEPDTTSSLAEGELRGVVPSFCLPSPPPPTTAR